MATISKSQFQHAYSDPVRDSDISCPEPSLAQQQFKDEVDINALMARFKVTGQMPVGASVPSYGDFSGVTDYRTAMDAVNRARDAFMAYPADLRSRFMNDPQKFLEFVSDPVNLDECRKLGLAIPAKPDVPAVAPAGAPATS